MSKRKWIPWLVVIIIIIILIAGDYFYKNKTHAEHTAVWKGRQVAMKEGCFSCHGFEGLQGIKNPGSEYGSAPSWQGGTAMMFIDTITDLKEWVMYGHPKSLKEKPKGLIKMQAFKDKISSEDMDNLLVYLKAVMELIDINDDSAKAGYETIKTLGCFGCHGPYGMGGMPNGGSLKGYTPGWDGKDYAALVKDDQELKDWIMNGNIDRLKNNMAARHYQKKQNINMPAYKPYLSQSKLNEVVSYIHWLRKYQP